MSQQPIEVLILKIKLSDGWIYLISDFDENKELTFDDYILEHWFSYCYTSLTGWRQLNFDEIGNILLTDKFY